ncbi:hypothetical protein DCAR_0104953 [Daucus carota subsp. sativus]|uniref:non-specific serine/threonine protein kinase n=2 Tax=Daucus carota subsp. sativus TaxID=79200 RepID=A0AAF0W9G2_DAUCS|nr:hypothetical protein DCAR_0104953 [Daucus carota subsp. sativus]
MTFSFLQFIILSILILKTSTQVHAFRNNVTDHQALLSFKASIKDDPLGALDSWNNSIHFCHWNGVTCSARRERVVSLNLSSQHLVGSLSPHIGNLSFIRLMDIHENEFHGLIPDEIGRLFRLQHLALGNNSFRGEFPANLSHCVNILRIGMSGNNLQGKLPVGFSSWPKLNEIRLGNNHFTGSIPPSIGNITNLRYLGLGRNNLAGSIPSEIAHHTKLEILILQGNRLSGMVPVKLFNISSLRVFSLANNDLQGTLPPDWGSILPNLESFYAGVNRISGQLSPSIANASSLVNFDVLGNSITGPIQNNFGLLPNLQLLSLGQNPLGDNLDDLSFINSLVNCTRLWILTLHESNLRGELPSSIVNLSQTLEELYMYGNHIYGRVPPEIRNLENMIVLELDDNRLTGSIPESIGELSQLNGMDLSGNNISGVIPTSIGNLTQLIGLAVYDNMLEGSIPTRLFNISTMENVALANNRLGGEIPEQIGFWSRCLSLDLSQNLFTGVLPSRVGRLKQLVQLDVSYNKLTGGIPVTLGECVMLEELYMEANLFQGKIPSSFKALKNLAVLDLSTNNLSGDIPRFFDNFHMIFLNLSHNKLGGEVSRKGLFSNASAFSVVGNLELCGGIQALQFPACPVKVLGSRKKTFPLRMILLIVLVPLGVLLACLAFICLRRRNSKKLDDPALVLRGDQFPKLSYQDLRLATNEFSVDNFLGQGRYGSVYKGVLESGEDIVAVKVLNIEVRGANKSFLAECETLRNIRHRNLLKIITACSSTDFKGNDFKALVFEFMTNGSVDDWLHPTPSYQGNERNLNLLRRLSIVIDVALGVDYLHHHSHASIIHSDLKPSNILLDEDFIAHIGDFGLARISFATTNEINQTQMSSTGIRGTIGYVPPEYGMGGEISIKGDVYSYGILLLEIFSGKRPTERSIFIDGDSNLHDYVRRALPHSVMDIADPRIVLEPEENGLTLNQSYSRSVMEVCLASIFEVGILCSAEEPQKRIDISVAIKLLHAARDKLLQRRP